MNGSNDPSTRKTSGNGRAISHEYQAEIEERKSIRQNNETIRTQRPPVTQTSCL
jgi:hypothetical protein